MLRLTALLASLAGLLALPAAAHAYTFAEWDTSGHPGGITAQGGLYFTLPGAIGSSSLGGVQSSRTVAPASLRKIVAGSNDDLWYLDTGANKLWRDVPGGSTTEFLPLDGAPTDLAAGPSGDMWVTAEGRLACATTVMRSQYATPAALPSPDGIVLGGDGAMWVV